MTITQQTKDNTTTLFIEGWLDTQASPQLGEAVSAVNNSHNLILDFDKLEYISSSGLREIVSAYKMVTAAGCKFSIVNVGADVMDVFKLTNFDKKLDISAK